MVDVDSDGRGNLKRRRQPVAGRCRQAAGVDAAVNVDLKRIARCERDGSLSFEDLVLHGAVAGYTCLSFGDRPPVVGAGVQMTSAPSDVAASPCSGMGHAKAISAVATWSWRPHDANGLPSKKVCINSGAVLAGSSPAGELGGRLRGFASRDGMWRQSTEGWIEPPDDYGCAVERVDIKVRISAVDIR